MLRVIAVAVTLGVFLSAALTIVPRAVEGYMSLRERLGDVTKNNLARRRAASFAANLIFAAGALCGLGLLIVTLSMTRYIG